MTRWTAGGIAAAMLAVVPFAIAVAVDPARAWFAYLAAYVAVLTVALGALSMLLMAHLTGAVWFVVLRRLTEGAAAMIPLLALAALPLAFVLPTLYPWVHPHDLPEHVQVLVGRISAYLNVPFFLARAASVLTAWSVMTIVLLRWSGQQDTGTRSNPPFRGFSAIAAIVLAFTLTCAAFDWLMSLSPEWYSTIYGVRVFASAMLGALGLIAVVAGRAAGTARCPLPVGNAHLNALGSLLIAFVLFWAYVAFSQLLVIWIGNEPREISWYVRRSTGGWALAGVALLAANFAVPFLALLFHNVRHSARAMAWLGGWLLAIHYFDLYWLVMPELGSYRLSGIWIDASAVALLAGPAAAWAVRRVRSSSIVAVGDPALHESIAYEGQ